MDQHQASRSNGCNGQGKRLCDDGGQVELVILVYLWHTNLPYRSHDLPQVTDFEIQEEKKRYTYIINVQNQNQKTVRMSWLIKQFISFLNLHQFILFKAYIVDEMLSFKTFTHDFRWFATTISENYDLSKMRKHPDSFLSHCTLVKEQLGHSRNVCTAYLEVQGYAGIE